MENNTPALIPTGGVWLSHTNSKLEEIFLLTINFSYVNVDNVNNGKHNK